MSISTILKSKAEPGEKLEAVAKIVAKVRKKYGNAEVEVPVPDVTTPEGLMPFTALDSDAKVELLVSRLVSIKASVIEQTRSVKGTVSTRVEESLLSTDDMFCNISTTTGMDYL